MSLVPDVDELFDVLLGHRAEASDAAVEGLVEWEGFLSANPTCPQRGSLRGETQNVLLPLKLVVRFFCPWS